MTYRVIATPEADEDSLSILHYLHSYSPEGAESWMRAYEAATMRLASFADGCSLAEEYQRFAIEVRQLLFRTRRGRPYRLLFTIVGNEVRILRVRGPGQSDVGPDEIRGGDD
jgi:plasmid stabilization system protein ParE